MPLKEFEFEVEQKMKKTIESAKREFAEVRTGRAHPGLIEGLHADYFGTPTLVKQMANISVPDPRTIVIQPYDPNAIAEIEKAITNSSLGISPSNDGKVIRLNVPTLSEERRQEMIKVVKEMAEHGRVSLRTIRRDANDKIKKLKSDKEIGEDDEHRGHDEVQKITDKYIKEIDNILHDKTEVLSAH
jgi:ribosome recycling factor